MYCVLVLAVGFIALTTAVDFTEEIKQCVDYLETVRQCCKQNTSMKQKQKKFLVEEHLQECMLIPKIPSNCDRDICFGTKMGYSTSDGAVNMDAFVKMLDDKMENQRELFDAVNKSCINGDFEVYGEADDCDLRKLSNCINIQVVFRCPEFSDEGSCKGSNDTAEICLELSS